MSDQFEILKTDSIQVSSHARRMTALASAIKTTGELLTQEGGDNGLTSESVDSSNRFRIALRQHFLTLTINLGSIGFTVPMAMISAHEAEAAKKFLIYRRNNISGLVKLNRNEFKGVRTWSLILP